MSPIVLDASAVLAVVLRERGHERVLALGKAGHMSTVNMSEARARLWDLGYSAADIDLALENVDATIMDFTATHARQAGDLRPLTRKAGLSLGDRACLALAIALDGTALTADRAWATLDLPVSVELIR